MTLSSFSTSIPLFAIGAGIAAIVGLTLFPRLRDWLRRRKFEAQMREHIREREAAGLPDIAVFDQNLRFETSGHGRAAESLMPMLVSLLVLVSALFVILMNDTYSDAQQKWAFGAVGTILGYWLKK